METLIVHPRTQKELATLEAILKALDMPFHKQQEGFDPSFSGKMETSASAGPAGNGRKSQRDDVWKLE
jgi:hypothetical protein